MTAKDAIRSAIGLSLHTIQNLVADFNDREMLERVSPNANHASWIFGHLIVSEIRQGSTIGALPILLPDGFQDKHSGGIASPEATGHWNASDNPADFWPKETYVNLLDQVRCETLKALEVATEETLAQPTRGPIAGLAPRLLDLMLLVGSHQSFHAGQISAIRRKLGKPVLF